MLLETPSILPGTVVLLSTPYVNISFELYCSYSGKLQESEDRPWGMLIMFRSYLEFWMFEIESSWNLNGLRSSRKSTCIQVVFLDDFPAAQRNSRSLIMYRNFQKWVSLRTLLQWKGLWPSSSRTSWSRNRDFWRHPFVVFHSRMEKYCGSSTSPGFKLRLFQRYCSVTASIWWIVFELYQLRSDWFFWSRTCAYISFAFGSQCFEETVQCLHVIGFSSYSKVLVKAVMILQLCLHFQIFSIDTFWV